MYAASANESLIHLNCCNVYIIGFAERTVRGYWKEFVENSFKFQDSQQGKWERHLILNDENLRKRASKWVCENACIKGAPNMTTAMFCEYVNSPSKPFSTTKLPTTLHFASESHKMAAPSWLQTYKS